MWTETDLFHQPVTIHSPRYTPPRFDGATYDPAKDCARLTGQMERVYKLMTDGAWHTLPELAKAVQGSEAGVSARLRDLRKARFGGHVVDKRRVEGGLWEYRLEKIVEKNG